MKGKVWGKKGFKAEWSGVIKSSLYLGVVINTCIHICNIYIFQLV